MSWTDKHKPSAGDELTGGGGEPPVDDDSPVAFARFKGSEYWPGLTFNRVDGDAFGWPYTHLVHWKFEGRGVIELKFIDDRVINVRITGRNLRKGFDMIRQRQCGDVYEQHIGEFDAEESASYIDNITVREDGGSA